MQKIIQRKKQQNNCIYAEHKHMKEFEMGCNN
jgi:hypothetical protein